MSCTTVVAASITNCVAMLATVGCQVRRACCNQEGPRVCAVLAALLPHAALVVLGVCPNRCNCDG
jgi:hypothetical protein